jgi:hypothetical protein
LVLTAEIKPLKATVNFSDTAIQAIRSHLTQQGIMLNTSREGLVQNLSSALINEKGKEAYVKFKSNAVPGVSSETLGAYKQSRSIYIQNSVKFVGGDLLIFISSKDEADFDKLAEDSGYIEKVNKFLSYNEDVIYRILGEEFLYVFFEYDNKTDIQSGSLRCYIYNKDLVII